MKVTDVSIKVRDNEKLRGFVTITFDNCLVVRGIKIIKARGRLFLAMPNFRRPDGTYIDTFHPVNQRTREELERLVLQEYRSLMSEARDDEVESGSVRSPVRSDSGPRDGKATRRFSREPDDWNGHDHVSPA